MIYLAALGAIASFLLVTCWRMYSILPKNGATCPPKNRSEPCSLAVFLGSGGHTTEALKLTSALDFDRYRPRTYIISEGDILSVDKAHAMETHKAATTASLRDATAPPVSPSKDYRIVTIPRARRVHQSFMATPPTAIWSLLSCIALVFSGGKDGACLADVLILNGPGTCVVLCMAVYLNRFLGIASPRVIYIESFARVGTLSLSGKLLRPLVDRFFVQWPDVLKNGGRGECHGWLV